MTMRHKKKKCKEPKTHWTEKLGGNIGRGINKAFSNKKVVFVVITAFLLILFIFIVPLKNNIISIVLLTVLVIAYFILRQKAKRM